MFIGVLPQPEQQLVAVQGRDRTTEQSLSVSGSPMSWAAWRASLRSRTRQKTSVGSPPTIAIVILGVKALGLSFRSCGSIKVAY